MHMKCIKYIYIYIFISFVTCLCLSCLCINNMFIKDGSSLVQPRTIHSRSLKLNNCSHITKTDPTTIKI